MKFILNLNAILKSNFTLGIRPIYMDGGFTGGGGSRGPVLGTAAAGDNTNNANINNNAASRHSGSSTRLHPTNVTRQGHMPGFSGLQSRVQLSTSLLINLCIHGAHKCPDNSSSETKKQWVDYTKKQFNINGIVDGVAPCQLYELWNTTDYHLKMKDRVLKIGAYFDNKYNLRHEQDGDDAEFTDAEVYGHRMIEERKAALNAYKEDRAAQVAEKEQNQQENHEAEELLNLVSPGRGVSSPGGVALGENELEGLAALGQQPLSNAQYDIHRAHQNAIIALQAQYDDGILEVQDVHNDNSDDDSDDEGPAAPDFNYPEGSNVRDRYNVEASNAEAAGTEAAAASAKRKRNKKRKQYKSGGGPGGHRVYPRMQDINGMLKSVTSDIKTSASSSNQLMGVLLASLQQQQQQPTNNGNDAANTRQSSVSRSPNTENTKRLSRIKDLQDFLLTLKEEEKMLRDNGQDTSDNVQRQSRYRNHIQNLEDEMFAASST